MAWADAGQRLAAMPDAGTGRDFAVSNRPVVSTPATAACRCRYQSLTAGSMIYDHVSNSREAINQHLRSMWKQGAHPNAPRTTPGRPEQERTEGETALDENHDGTPTQEHTALQKMP